MNYLPLKINSFNVENEFDGSLTKTNLGFQLSLIKPNTWVGVKITSDFENQKIYSITFNSYSECDSSLLEIWGHDNNQKIKITSFKINSSSKKYETLFTNFGSNQFSFVFSAAMGFPIGNIFIENIQIAYVSDLENTGIELSTGSHHYRAFVAHPTRYDLVGSNQFNLLTVYGLREYHYLLDLGCGSLNGGRLFIPYLLPNKYFGIEPEQWLIDDGIQNNLGIDLLNIKHPTFSNDKNFTCTIFDKKFDYILAHSIFSHASPNQIRRCFSEVNQVMHPNSLFFFSFMNDKKIFYEDRWIYPDCWTYTIDFITSLAIENGLFCEKCEWPHSGNQIWMVTAKEKNKIPSPFIKFD